MQNLTGKWFCPEDGLTYGFTQLDNTLYIGANNGSTINTGFGIIDLDQQSFILHWADLPGSTGMGNHGIMYCDASVDGKITKKIGSERFGIGSFTRVS